MDIDIIIYAIVAAILLIRLWSILGRRDTDDVTRPNPFVAPLPPPQETTDASLAAEGDKGQPLPRVIQPFLLPVDSLAGGLKKVTDLDPSFDEKKFLQGARLAFAMIIENFANDNLASIEKLLGEKVLPQFRSAITERQKAGQKMESKIIKIIDAEITKISTDATHVFITVRFVSDQENILRDTAGHILGGAVGKIEEVTDVWTFSRDTQSGDPNWILVETRG